MPAFLAIETSHGRGGVAVRGPGGTVDVEMLAPAARHDDDLLPAIERLLARQGLRAGDLAAVGVSIGPGGFTGLRIAVTTAKMLGEALGAELVAVPTALVVGEAHDQGGARSGPIISALATKRDTFWCTRLRRDPGGWEIVGAGHLLHAEAFDPEGAAAVLADEHFPDLARARCIQARVPVIAPRFDPRACLIAAERRRACGQTIDPLALQPIYPRPPEAVSLFETRATVR